MAFNVRFNFVDSYNTKTSRSFHSTSATIALLQADIAALASAIDPLTDAGLVDAVASYVDTAGAFAAAAGSNIDTNMSANALGADGYIYDVDIPVPVGSIINNDRTLITGDANVVTFFNLFGAGGTWRVNLRNPTSISQLVGGTLDK